MKKIITSMLLLTGTALFANSVTFQNITNDEIEVDVYAQAGNGHTYSKTYLLKPGSPKQKWSFEGTVTTFKLTDKTNKNVLSNSSDTHVTYGTDHVSQSKYNDVLFIYIDTTNNQLQTSFYQPAPANLLYSSNTVTWQSASKNGNCALAVSNGTSILYFDFGTASTQKPVQIPCTYNKPVQIPQGATSVILRVFGKSSNHCQGEQNCQNQSSTYNLVSNPLNLAAGNNYINFENNGSTISPTPVSKKNLC